MNTEPADYRQQQECEEEERWICEEEQNFLDLQQAKKDVARMDWLVKQPNIGIWETCFGRYKYYAGESFGNLRDVVDAAMEKENK